VPIHILPEDLASKIAAGEVIERPASVVKELIENSIDAGAREIRVEIRGGGQRLIRVADDGAGIPAAEVPVAFARHATSKLDTADDLFRIQTLGFRGEALPSIAAVSRVALITRARGEESGTQMRVDGSKVIDQRATGAPAGTIVTVEELFRHVPARLKFLKTPTTEAGHIADLVSAYALGYPHLRFSLVNDDRLIFQSPGTNLKDALVKVLGIEIAAQMLEIGRGKLEEGSWKLENSSSVQASGYTSPPALNKATRKFLFFFVNHRWVQDRALARAVIEAYHTSLMVGRFPIVVLDVTIPPDAVDVNVHPTKREVRFRDPSAIFSTVQRAVRATLTASAPIPTVSIPRDFARPSAADSQLAINLQQTANSRQQAADFQPPTTQPPNYLTTQLPMLRVLGQILSTYIIAEGPDGIYLIDQHAAHERVLYEQLRAEKAGATLAVQTLLDPAPLELTPAQNAALDANTETLAAYGFRIEPFGAQTILLRAVPALMKTSDPRGALVEILEEMEQGEAPLEKSAEARLITSICKGIAVKGGMVMALEEMRELVRRLEQTASPRTCPHGRPTMIQLNVAMLEREFGRK
jgi:DNA mismatch repair protein MutL